MFGAPSIVRASWGSALVCAALAVPLPAAAGLFSSGIPLGWAIVGGAGTSAADGDVGLSPAGSSRYGWVSTAGGVVDQGTLPGVGNGSPGFANGSTLTSHPFPALAGQGLRFFFNYVTSDGAGYADYAWARLLDFSMNQVAVLFTARTTPGGNTVPGFDLPAVAATMTPANVVIPDAPFVDPSDPSLGRIGPTWGPLSETPGTCWDIGCGLTGWVQSDYSFTNSGNYYLQFWVTNWGDDAVNSGLAFDGITIDGRPIQDVVIPLPAPVLLLASGLVALFAFRRRQSA